MSKNLPVFVTDSQIRQIVWGPDGKFQLCWDNTVLHLCPIQFARVNLLLEEGVFDLYLTEVRDEDYCLRQDKPGHFQLFLGKAIRLDLPLIDFLSLVTLAHNAARRLERVESEQ